MKVSIIFEDKASDIEELEISEKFDKGKFDVYHVYSPSRRSNLALKTFPTTALGVIHYTQEQVLSNLSHPNIIKCIPIKCHKDSFLGILTELAEYGEFLDLVMKGVFSSEELIRTYFHQLVEGIEYLHSKDLAHLDLKLDNLVLGSDYNLKIIDFDQAQSPNNIKAKPLGSVSYRAPEVIDKKCKDFFAADIYSAGVILYTLAVKKFPFTEIIDNKGIRLKHYSTFVKDNNGFWKAKVTNLQGNSFLNEDLIELLNGMLAYDVQKRFKIYEIKNSKWYQGFVLGEEALKTEMKNALERSST